MTWWEKIIPPDDPGKLATWRGFVAVFILVLIADALSGRGWILPFGEYAYAEEMAEQAEKIDRILAMQIASALRDLRVEQCRSNERIIADTIEDYQQEFREVTGERYPLPPCREERS